MRKKLYFGLILFLLLIGLIFVHPSGTLATTVDQSSLCNLEGYPGKSLDIPITLLGNETEVRTGYWDKTYKQIDGDNEKMDITSWISIEPKEYTLAQGQSQTFTIHIKVPNDATPGLWGATSIDAGQSGHSAERRTYILFKDVITGGNVYSGILIPVSVQVLGKANPFIPIISFVQDHLIVIILVVIIVILLVLLIPRMRSRRAN
jgi:hypothetical protein